MFKKKECSLEKKKKFTVYVWIKSINLVLILFDYLVYQKLYRKYKCTANLNDKIKLIYFKIFKIKNRIHRELKTNYTIYYLYVYIYIFMFIL